MSTPESCRIGPTESISVIADGLILNPDCRALGVDDTDGDGTGVDWVAERTGVPWAGSFIPDKSVRAGYVHHGKRAISN